MKMFDATLDLARTAQGVETHLISSVLSGNKFSCDTLNGRMNEFSNGGTCWFLSGDSAGQFYTIKRGKDQVIELQQSSMGVQSPLGTVPAKPGDSVALCSWHYFNTQNLVNAVNHVLYDYPIMEVYEDDSEFPQLYRQFQNEYDLPDEITTDIRRVEVEGYNPWNVYEGVQSPAGTVPGPRFVICHYWHLNGRKLIVDPRWIYKWNGRFRIHYVKNHGEILPPYTEQISEQVDATYLRKMANLWLWTHEIQAKHKESSKDG